MWGHDKRNGWIILLRWRRVWAEILLFVFGCIGCDKNTIFYGGRWSIQCDRIIDSFFMLNGKSPLSSGLNNRPFSFIKNAFDFILLALFCCQYAFRKKKRWKGPSFRFLCRDKGRSLSQGQRNFDRARWSNELAWGHEPLLHTVLLSLLKSTSISHYHTKHCTRFENTHWHFW